MWVSGNAYNQEACEYTYSIDFYKEHCGGDLSKPMSYLYQCCYNSYVKKKSILLWDITFTHEEDILHVNTTDSRFNGKITRISISGEEINEVTNGGYIL